MAYIPWWQRMSPPTFAERFELGGLAGRLGFNNGTKPYLDQAKFIEEFTTQRIKGDMTGPQFVEYLKENYSPSTQAKEGWNIGNVDRRLRKYQEKGLIPKDIVTKGSKVDRAITKEQMIELWGEDTYQKHKKNFSDIALRKKFVDDRKYARLTTEERKARSKKITLVKKKRLEAMSDADRRKFLDERAIKDAERTRKKRGERTKFHKDSRKFKSILWGDLVSRTYNNYSKNKTGELKIKSGGLEPPPFKFSEESLKLIKSKPDLNRVDMEKITLIDKNGKPFKWDTIESYVKEGNALNSKGQPMSWDEVTKTERIREFINKEGLAQKINKATIPNYNPVKHRRQSGWNIAHNTSFNNAPWEKHIAPARANTQEGRARKKFLNAWDGYNKEFKEGKITKEDRFKFRKKAMTEYKTTMELIPEIRYGLNKKQHGAATPIKELIKRAGLELNTAQTTKLSSILQSIMNKKNSGLNVVDIAKWGRAELGALDDIAGKLPSKALGAFGKILKVAGVAAIPLDAISFTEAHSKGLTPDVGVMNLAEIYTNLPGVIWEAGEWVASKVQGKKHEWKPFYEFEFGRDYQTKKYQETPIEVLEKRVDRFATDMVPQEDLDQVSSYLDRRGIPGITDENVQLQQYEEKLLKQMRKEKALADQKKKEERLTGVDKYILSNLDV